MSDGAFVTAVLASIGGLVWLVRLEGRVNTLQALMGKLTEDVGEIKADVKELLRK